MATPAKTDEEARARVQKLLDTYAYIKHRKQFEGYDVHFMSNVRLMSATTKGDLVWELDITAFYSNLNQVMHGGAAAVIFDMATTSCLATLQSPGYWDFMGGVSRTLNLSYLRAVPVGTTIKIKCEIVAVGKTMAMLRGRMESMDGKHVYATCEHHKAHVPSLGEHLQLREDMVAELQQKEKSKGQDKKGSKL